MNLHIKNTGASFGAFVTGVDLTRDLSADIIAKLRALWLKHKVLAFPDQNMSDEDLERFTQYFGDFGDTWRDDEKIKF